MDGQPMDGEEEGRAGSDGGDEEPRAPGSDESKEEAARSPAHASEPTQGEDAGDGEAEGPPSHAGEPDTPDAVPPPRRIEQALSSSDHASRVTRHDPRVPRQRRRLEIVEETEGEWAEEVPPDLQPQFRCTFQRCGSVFRQRDERRGER